MRLPSTLFPEERRQEITRIIGDRPRVTVAELSRLFAVSEVTIRKDLAVLEESGQIQRTHGGAIRVQAPADEEDFELRAQQQQVEKERIAAAAAELVHDGENVALDASTTVLQLARRLKERRDLTVITNSIRVGMELGGRSGTEVLIPGGTFRRDALSLVGSWGETILRQVRVQKAFVGAMGLTIAAGLTDVHSEEAQIKRVLVDGATEVIALIDHTKWEQVALITFCPLDNISMIITDDRAPQQIVEQVRAKGIRVLTV